MKMINSVLASAVALTMAGQVFAAVSSAEAAKLGSSLTAIGAEIDGNADGSIPKYTGGLTKPPASFKPGSTYRPDPFAGEKPVLAITDKNVAQYKSQLTATTQELLKRFPNYRVEVFPTHRTVVYPTALQANARKNAVAAETANGGLALKQVLPGVPFPIPKTGEEAMWNHLLRFQGVTFTTKYDSWNVNASGQAILASTGSTINSFPIYENLNKVLTDDDIFFQNKISFSGPARRAGEALMVKDYINPVQNPRKAWQYLPGVRRVKMAPTLAYDSPNPGTAGSSTYDDTYVFNGAMDRFNWKLVGKQEMFVPYNAYEVTYVKDPAKLTTPNFASPELVRWEKHRVWVVDATLKEGVRHIYKKRRFYLDEDSWIALASDEYDGRGQLYRGSFAFLTQSYDNNIPDASPHMVYDLVSGTYNINGLVGPYGGIKYVDPLPKTQWSQETLAGTGLR